MIIVENVTINGKEYKKTYSDQNKYIQKKGTERIYSEAIDKLTSTAEYVETDKEIEQEAE